MLIVDLASTLWGLEITAPLQRNLPWGANMAVECSVYEPTPRVIAQPPPVIRSSQRDTWKTGSTSSTSSEYHLCRLNVTMSLNGSTKWQLTSLLSCYFFCRFDVVYIIVIIKKICISTKIVLLEIHFSFGEVINSETQLAVRFADQLWIFPYPVWSLCLKDENL